MILRALASNQPYTLITLPLVTVGLMFPLFRVSNWNVVDTKFPMDSVFFPYYSSPAIILTILFVLILGGAMLANRVFNKHEFLNVPVFVPAFTYAMSASALCLIQMSIPALLANIFILLGLQRHLTIHRQPRVLTYAFESAFWYGMAAVVFPPYIVLLAGMLVAVLISRAFHWREILIPILSFGVPFLYWVVWMYVFDYHDHIILFQKTVSWDNIQYFSLLSWPEKLFVIATFIVFVAALPRYLILSERGTNKAKNVKHVFLIIALSIIASLIVGYLLLFKWVLLTAVVPLAFIAGYWFSNYRYSFLAPFVFYLYCVAAIVLVVATALIRA
jgi:hypothetical protein